MALVGWDYIVIVGRWGLSRGMHSRTLHHRSLVEPLGLSSGVKTHYTRPSPLAHAEFLALAVSEPPPLVDGVVLAPVVLCEGPDDTVE